MNHNPFIVRGLIRNVSSFWGRETDLRKLYCYLLDSENQPQSVAVVGQRRIGKSSLLYRIYKKELADQMYDDQLSHTICVMLSMQSLASSDTNIFYEKILENIKDQSVIFNEMIESLRTQFNNDNEKCFEQILRKISQDSSILILILDEFEEASRNANFDRDFFNKLRSYTQNYPCAFIVSVQNDLDKLWDKELIGSPFSSPFFNVFQTHTLRGFRNQDETQNYLLTFSNNAGHPFTKDAIALIGEIGGKHPFFINLGAYHVFETICHDGGSLDDAREKIDKDPALFGNFSYYWQKLSNGQQQTLINLKTQNDTPHLTSEAIVDLDWLERMSLVEKITSRNYQPFSSSFAEFIRNHEVIYQIKTPTGNWSIEQEIADLISQDESTQLEFKSSLRWDLLESRVNKELEKVVLKTIAAFLNTNGGTLLIGVDDENHPIGIVNDLNSLPNAKKRNKDGFQLYLLNLIKNEIGKEICELLKINFPKVGNFCICKLVCSPSPHPVYVGQEKKFYIRTGNSTSELTNPSEIIKYFNSHWQKHSIIFS